MTTSISGEAQKYQETDKCSNLVVETMFRRKWKRDCAIQFVMDCPPLSLIPPMCPPNICLCTQLAKKILFNIHHK